jgi:tetratricopeptide (TPR) repeat protein
MIESETETLKNNIVLASIFFKLAVLYSEKGDKEKTAEYHTLALENYETIFHENLSAPMFLQLFAYELEYIGVNRVASISCEVKDPETLYQYYTLARSVYEKLYDSDPECEEYQALLVRIVEELGNLDMKMNKFEKCRAELEYVVLLREKMQDSDPENPIYHLKLGNILNDLRIVYTFLQDLDKSKQILEKAISLNEKLLESEPESLEYQEQAAAMFTNYSNVLAEMGKAEEAEQY